MYVKIAEKIKVAVLFPKPSYNSSCINLNPQSNILHIYGYNWKNLFLLTAFHAIKVLIYNQMCFISMDFIAFCGNNFENMGIILRQ